MELFRFVRGPKRPRDNLRLSLGDLAARFALELALDLGPDRKAEPSRYVAHLRREYASFATCQESNGLLGHAERLREVHVRDKGEDPTRKVRDKVASKYFNERFDDIRWIEPRLVPDLAGSALPWPLDRLPSGDAMKAQLQEWKASQPARQLLRLVTGDGLHEYRPASALLEPAALDDSGGD